MGDNQTAKEEEERISLPNQIYYLLIWLHLPHHITSVRSVSTDIYTRVHFLVSNCIKHAFRQASPQALEKKKELFIPQFCTINSFWSSDQGNCTLRGSCRRSTERNNIPMKESLQPSSHARRHILPQSKAAHFRQAHRHVKHDMKCTACSRVQIYTDFHYDTDESSDFVRTSSCQVGL